MSTLCNQIEEYGHDLNETAIATGWNLIKAVKGQDSSEFGKGVSKTATAPKISLSDTDFKYAFETDGIQDGEEAVQSMVVCPLIVIVISDTSTKFIK